MKKKTKPKGQAVLSVRMPSEMHAQVSKRAKKLGVTVAEYIRYLIRLGEQPGDIYVKGSNGEMEKVRPI